MFLLKRLFASLLVILLIASTLSVQTFAVSTKTKIHSWFITINLSTLKLTIYDNKKLYKSFPVAIGTKSNPTPTGKFTILTKRVNPAWGGNGNPNAAKAGGASDNPLGPRWLGTSAGSSPGNSIGIHGNIDAKSIGTRASHGCIRMYNSDIVAIYKFIPIGTSVWIGSSQKLAQWGIK